MKKKIDYFNKTKIAYEYMCKDLCNEYGINQTCFDILMFLGNNPEYKYASDIVDVRKIKANLVSINVDKLVNEGFLIKEAVKEDKRKTKLVCTLKANEFVKKGRKVQRKFHDLMFKEIDEETKETFFKTLEKIENNVEEIFKETR